MAGKVTVSKLTFGLVTALLVRSNPLDRGVLLFKLSSKGKAVGSTHVSAQTPSVVLAVVATKGKDAEELFYLAQILPDGIVYLDVQCQTCCASKQGRDSG